MNSETISIRKEVRQECLLSLLLFNIYYEAILLDSLVGNKGELEIIGAKKNNIRNADDNGLFTHNIDDYLEVPSLMQRIIQE